MNNEGSIKKVWQSFESIDDEINRLEKDQTPAVGKRTGGKETVAQWMENVEECHNSLASLVPLAECWCTWVMLSWIPVSVCTTWAAANPAGSPSLLWPPWPPPRFHGEYDLDMPRPRLQNILLQRKASGYLYEPCIHSLL